MMRALLRLLLKVFLPNPNMTMPVEFPMAVGALSRKIAMSHRDALRL